MGSTDDDRIVRIYYDAFASEQSRDGVLVFNSTRPEPQRDVVNIPDEPKGEWLRQRWENSFHSMLLIAITSWVTPYPWTTDALAMVCCGLLVVFVLAFEGY